MPPRRRATSKARADSPSLQAAARAPVLLAVRCAPRRIARPVNDNREIDFTFDASRPVLSRLPFAAALWSLDRRRCALNHGAHRLLGFGAEDFLRCASLWVERIHPQDRDAFAAAWRRVESGETESASCHYRFLPRHRSALIHVGEFLFCGAPRADENTTVWSVYAEEADFEEAVLETAPVRELVQGMNHELGNSLQAIKGEVDLLRLAGALPPENAGGISRGIERIAQLAGELDEYLAPPPPEPRRENPETAVRQVLAARAERLEARGIGVALEVKEALPELALGSDFRNAFARIVDLSLALLPDGGDLRIEARRRCAAGASFAEVQVIETAPGGFAVEETEMFRPYLKVNQRCIGLTLAIARRLLCRCGGQIIFHRARRGRGVFSISIPIPAPKPNGFQR